jgi:hypothetical protein
MSHSMSANTKARHKRMYLSHFFNAQEAVEETLGLIELQVREQLHGLVGHDQVSHHGTHHGLHLTI